MKRAEGGCVAMVAGLLVALLAVAASPARADPAGAPPPPVSLYLVQSSGWMEPFYADPASPFKPVLLRLIAASRAGGEVILADFHQQCAASAGTSLEKRFDGAYDAAQLAAVADGLRLIPCPNGKLPDADFDGALLGSITSLLANRSGIIWFISNNRNSPDNSQEVDANTRAFAQRLSNTAALPAIVAYPLYMPVHGRLANDGHLVTHGRLFDETGLIIYGIAYGDRAAARLREIVRAAPMARTLFTDPPVQLKPLDQAELSFAPRSLETTGLDARMHDGVLRLDGLHGGQATHVAIGGVLQSSFYPHVIDSGTVEISLTGAMGALAASVTPALIGPVPPGGGAALRLDLDLPGIARPPGLSGLMQNDVSQDLVLQIGLQDLKLSLQDKFVTRMQQIKALDQLPAVFFDYSRVNATTIRIPLHVTAHYSALPLILYGAAAGAGVAALLLLLLLLGRPAEQIVRVGGQTRRIRMRRLERRTLQLIDGQKVTVSRPLFGAARVTAGGANKVS